MKTPLLWLALSLSTASVLAAEVVPGVLYEEAVATLGAPRGRLQVGERNLVYFERGAIEVQDGRVTSVDLRTPEENALLLAREEQQRSSREARRRELVTAGTAERDARLMDENFRSAPLAYQVSYWQDFARRYPDVSVIEPLAIARLKFNEQWEQRQRVDREEQRREEREEMELVAQRDRTEFYPLYTGSSYYGRYRRPYHQPGLGPISYNFYSSPLPPYSTPSGNPAGNLRGPIINFPTTNPALPNRFNQPDNRRWNGGNDRSHRRDRTGDRNRW